MDCPKCSKAMSFVPANQNWWCNDCLAATEGEAPAELKGPTVDQVADQRHQASHGTVAAAGSRAGSWLDLEDLLFLVPIGMLAGGGLLIYTGSVVVGAILIAAVFLGAYLID